jgi:hypothetical protein
VYKVLRLVTITITIIIIIFLPLFPTSSTDYVVVPTTFPVDIDLAISHQEKNKYICM